MRRPTVLLAALLLASTLPTASASTTLTVEISNASANEAHFMEDFDTVSIGFGDFDGDGRVEIVAYNDNRRLYVMSTTEPRILAEWQPPTAGDGAAPNTSPVVKDVDGDGALDIIVVTHAAYVCRYEYDAAASTSTSFAFSQRWCKRASTYDGAGANADGAPWVDDVDGDGDMEIFMQTEQRGLFAYRHDGSLLWSKDVSGGNAGPVASDLDGDGIKDVVFFGDAGQVRAVNGRTGSTLWSTRVSGLWPASIVVGGSIGDLEGDGKKEIAFIARDASHTDDYDDNHFVLFVYRHDGSLKWRAQPSWGNPMSYSHPVFADVDRDGRDEIIAQDWNTMGHKPGDWEQLGKANVFAYRADGTLLWRTELTNGWSNDDTPVGDFDGDGKLEVMAIGSSSGAEGFWLLDARTGARETHVAAGPWSAHRGPWAVDLDSSGLDEDLDIVLNVRTSSKGGGFRVYDTDVVCSVVFGAWGLTDPCAPPAGTGIPPPPPPPPGTFAAVFSDVKGNEWWVETDVDANEPLAGVDARVDDGAWVALTHRDWGAWAKSIRAPEGSIVQFRARSTDGDQNLSGCYRWTSATPTSCGGSPPPPPPPGDFVAAFSDVKGNEWWVETDVDANEPLAGVDARVNGGTWIALTHRDWGAWAKSIHAPQDSIVQFRARSTDGDEALSGCYRWTSATPADCGGQPPPPPGDFQATFRNVRGNEWWVETDVDANKPLAGVDARVNGGAWVALEPKSWGSWAKSMKAPTGSTVEFRARSTDGQVVQSAPYRWPPS